MKHWDPGDLATRAAGRPAPRRGRAGRSALGSRVGLALAIAFVVGLAWAIAPTSPVARELRR